MDCESIYIFMLWDLNKYSSSLYSQAIPGSLGGNKVQFYVSLVSDGTALWKHINCPTKKAGSIFKDSQSCCFLIFLSVKPPNVIWSISGKSFDRGLLHQRDSVISIWALLSNVEKIIISFICNINLSSFCLNPKKRRFQERHFKFPITLIANLAPIEFEFDVLRPF